MRENPKLYAKHYSILTKCGLSRQPTDGGALCCCSSPSVPSPILWAQPSRTCLPYSTRRGRGVFAQKGMAQKLGKEGHHVTRVGQSRVIVWDAFLRGSYARQRARSCIIVYERLNELRNEIRPQTLVCVWSIANACSWSGRGAGI